MKERYKINVFYQYRDSENTANMYIYRFTTGYPNAMINIKEDSHMTALNKYDLAVHVSKLLSHITPTNLV